MLGFVAMQALLLAEQRRLLSSCGAQAACGGVSVAEPGSGVAGVSLPCNVKSSWARDSTVSYELASVLTTDHQAVPAL